MTDPRRLDAARRMVGAPRDAPATPALLLDLPRAERNIAKMARRMDDLPAGAAPAHQGAQEPHAGAHADRRRRDRHRHARPCGRRALMADGDRRRADRQPGRRSRCKAAELARIAGLGQVMVAVDDASQRRTARARGRRRRLASSACCRDRRGPAPVPGCAAGRGGRSSSDADVTRRAGLRLAGCWATRATACSSPTAALRIAKAHAANDAPDRRRRCLRPRRAVHRQSSPPAASAPGTSPAPTPDHRDPRRLIHVHGRLPRRARARASRSR